MAGYEQQTQTPEQAQQQSTNGPDEAGRRDELRGMSFAQGQQALRPDQRVDVHEAHDSRLGERKTPVEVDVQDQRGDEGKPIQLKVRAKDPDEPGRLNHLWFRWRQTGGPKWTKTRGMYRPDFAFTAPYVKGDQRIVGEVTVTKRGYLNVRGLSTTERFEVVVRDVADEQPGPKQARQKADPQQQALPGTLPPMTLLMPWLKMMQQYRAPAAKPQPPQVRAPGETRVTPGDRASLEASVVDPDGGPMGMRTVWTQESGPPIEDARGQSTPALSFKTPNVSSRQVIQGRVTAVDKTGLKGEDRFRVIVEPRVAANEKGRVWGDPHFVGGDGGKYDIMGRDGGVYQILNDAGVQLNAKFKKWSRTNITVVDQCGGVISFKDAAGRVKRSEVYFESGLAKLDGKPMPRNKSVRLADGGSALFLSNGDLIIDTREGYKVTFHSMGSGNRRYVNFEVETGARGVGDGGAAGGLLGQTFDADQKARHGRKGAGAQGEGAIEGVVWDYEVSGGVFGTPKAGKAAPQPLSESGGRPLQRSTVLVAANPTDLSHGGFVDSGIDVTAGDEIRVKASGKATEHGRNHNRNPNGDARYRHPRKADFLCASAPAFALVGRVGGGASFMVGSSHNGRATASGRLLLGFNDLAGTFRDNSGEYLADVQVLKGVTQEAPAPTATAQGRPAPMQQTAAARERAQQNFKSLLSLLPAAAAAEAAEQPDVPWKQTTKPQAQATYTNPAAAALLLQMAKRSMAQRPPARPLPALPPLKHAPTVRPNVSRPPWLPQRKVLARPIVSAPAEKTLQSGELGRMTTKVVDPDQGKFGPARVEWRQEGGPRLEQVKGQGTSTLEFKAPDASRRSTTTGRVIAVDADGMRGEARFRVNVEPRMAVSEKGRIWGDPHFEGADGGKFDVQGRPGGVYNLISDAGLRVSALFKAYHRNTVTVMDRIGVVLTGTSGGQTKRSDVEFRPDRALVNGRPLPKFRPVELADGGSALYMGDHLIIDTREGYKLTCKARGGGSMRYCDMDVESGARGVGSDGAAGGLLGQTFDADKKAKHGRRGHGAQGEGAIAGVVTDYELRGGVFGRTKDGSAAPEAAQSDRRLFRKTVLVQANPGQGREGYIDTGFAVENGDTVLVRGSGRASEHGRNLRRGPQGDRGYRHSRKHDFMAPGAPAFALVGRLSGQRQGFMVGSSFRGKMARGGKLQLAFNDLAGTFGDNHGHYVADVQVIKEFA